MTKPLARFIAVSVLLPVLVFLCGIAIALGADVINAETFTIRNGVMFGMSMDEVVEKEGRDPDFTLGDAFVYRQQSVANLPTDVYFSFSLNGLDSILYDFTTTYSSFNSYHTDFEGVKSALTDKYGVPAADEKKVNGRQYGQGLSYYVEAFNAGDVSYRVGWQLEDVMIVLSLGKDDSGIIMRLIYAHVQETRKTPISNEGL